MIKEKLTRSDALAFAQQLLNENKYPEYCEAIIRFLSSELLSRADSAELQFWRETNRRNAHIKDHATGMSLSEKIFHIRASAVK